MRNFSVFTIGLFVAVFSLGVLRGWAQTDTQPTSIYEPTILEKKDAIGVIRKQITEGLEEGKKKGVDQDENLAAKRMSANEIYFRLEGFEKKLRKAYGGRVPDSLFDEAKDEFFQKDFNRVSDEVFKGKLNKDAVETYAGALKLANWRANFADENKNTPFMVHLTDEELKDPKGVLDGANSGMADKVRHSVMDDIQKDWEASKGKDLGPNPVKTPGDQDDAYVTHVKKLCQGWINQWGSGDDKNDYHMGEFKKACLKADYDILTKDRLEFQRKTGQPIAQAYVEGPLSTYVLAYLNCSMEKSLTNFNVDLNKVLDGMLNSMANDIAHDGIHRLIGF